MCTDLISKFLLTPQAQAQNKLSSSNLTINGERRDLLLTKSEIVSQLTMNEVWELETGDRLMPGLSRLIPAPLTMMATGLGPGLRPSRLARVRSESIKH